MSFYGFSLRRAAVSNRADMPFLGQDWRSPGQNWVKTDEGWKRRTADDKNNNVSVERLVV